VQSENDAEGYTEYTKRVCFRKQLKPRSLDIPKREMMRTTFILLLLAIGTLYCVEQVAVSEEALSAHVEFMTSTNEYRNYEHPATLDSVADYIDSVFSLYTSRVSHQVFEAENQYFQNVIASFGPEGGDRIIVGAHYDVCYDQPGADDNASGVAGLLEIAAMLSKTSANLSKRIDLVAFTLEEPPFFRTPYMGSAIHAQSLIDQGVDVKVMICLEMLGYYDETPGSQEYPLGILKRIFPSEGNFIAVISNFGSSRFARKIKKSINHNSEVHAIKLAAPSSLVGVDFSDHLNYWGHGYKAVLITDTAFYRNHNYHMKSDTPETLDFSKMAEVVAGVYSATLSFAD